MNGLFDWMSCLYFDICFFGLFGFQWNGCLFVCLFVCLVKWLASW